MTNKKPLTKSILTVALVTLGLLLIPLIGQQFSAEVNWTLSDFVAAGTLLFGTGSAFVFISRMAQNSMYKVAGGLALITLLFLVWSNLAVGLIGSEDEPANLMYFGIVFIGILGSIFSRFKALGMSYTSFAMAGGIVLIAIIALTMGMQDYSGSSVSEILAINAFFIVPFALSGLLFRQAIQDNFAQEHITT
jgi:hypothetical protein